MNKTIKLLMLSPMILVAASSLTSCNKTTNLTLRILNSEDYIYLSESDDPEDKDLIDRFVDYVNANYPQYRGVSVVYDTSDTNETIYSEIQTGKSNYDIINVSEYMAQKIVSGGYAVKLDYSKIPNYEAYASAEIKGRLDNIHVQKTDEYLKDYAVGYMWGTLGILFNPYFPSFEARGYSVEEVLTDMQDYASFWDGKYSGSISIKNSMRDTYALGVLYTYQEEFASLKEKLESGEITAEQYASEFAVIFNRSDANYVNEVQASLEELKSNIFGLEVDSGKQDIIMKKIGINLAWSGDAVYSMDQGDEAGAELYFSIPELGSNLWNDVWIMPNNSRSQEQNELAHIFLNYLCDPEIATLNMEYTGYTSFIGGDSILELVRDWYDVRTDEIYYDVEGEEETISAQVYGTDGVDFYAIDYPDFLKDSHDASKNNDQLRYFLPYENDEGELVEEPVDLDDLLTNGDFVYALDENDEPTEEVKTYGDLTIVNDDDSEIEEVNLSYFFNGTLSEYEDDIDTLFYSDCYLPFTYIDENGDEQQNKCVGRQFFTQYPSEETILRCAVMADYEDNNTYVMKMWENFKSDPLPTWAIIIFVVFIVAILVALAVILFNYLAMKKIRKMRNQ